MSELKRTEENTVKKVPTHPPKRVETTDGIIKKKPFWKRMKDALFVEGAKSVGLYLWNDVLLPAIKKLVADSATNAINMAVYGDTRPRYRDDGRTHVSNSSVYNGRVSTQMHYYNRTNRYNSILEGNEFTYKETALNIIHDAMDRIAEKGKISVEEFSQILPPHMAFEVVHTDRYWGWTSLNENCVVPTDRGWTIDLPPAKQL